MEPHDIMRLRNADYCNAHYQYRNANYRNADNRNAGLEPHDMPDGSRMTCQTGAA
jgi:hypothetical protein